LHPALKRLVNAVNPSASVNVVGAFAKLRTASVSFFMSVCQSPQGTSGLPLNGFSLNLAFEYFTRRTGTLREQLLILIIFRSFLLRMEKVKPKHAFYTSRIKDQLDVTCYFISPPMCSACFGH